MAAVHAWGETSGGAGSSPGREPGRGGQCGVGVQGTRKGVCEPGSRAPEERRGERRAPRSPVGSAAPVPGPQPLGGGACLQVAERAGARPPQPASPARAPASNPEPPSSLG